MQGKAPPGYFMDHLKKYFPELTSGQLNQFRHLEILYRFWNKKINLISRQDIGNLYLHHILHSLSIARFIKFAPGTKVLDVGTGGGFPGIPLAIMFPECQFHLVDLIEKKIRVVEVLHRSLGLRNVSAERTPAEMVTGQYNFAVTRAVADLSSLSRWTKNCIGGEVDNDFPNGLIALKGGLLMDELSPFQDLAYQFPLSDYFREEWFSDKFLIYLPQ